MGIRQRFVGILAAATVASVVGSGPALAGINDDGALDVVFANVRDANRACLGDGAGGFSCSIVSPEEFSSGGVALGYVNGDAFLDAVFANEDAGQDRVCLGDGAGGFTCSDVGPGLDFNGGVALGYVNGDAFLDAVFADLIDSPNSVCLGDGAGGFTCSDISADNRIFSRNVALGNVNGDAFLDAVFANVSGPNRRNHVCLGDGAGGFTCSDVSTDMNSSHGVAVGNVNGDDFLDVVFANQDSENRLCLGDGTGGFSCSDVSTDTNSSWNVALGSVDGDAFLDAVFANNNQANRVCLGDGAGGFTCSDVSADTNITIGIALGRVNGDAFLDAVFGNGTAGFRPEFEPQRNRVCLGDGAGGFTCSDVSADTQTSLAVALAPVLQTLGHFLLYRVSESDDSPHFEKRDVWLADQFGAGGYEVQEVEVLGNPADKDGEGMRDPDTHLVGYEIDADDDGRRRIALTVTNQFGVLTLNARSPDQLLVPSAKDLWATVEPLEQPGTEHFLCYRVSIPRGEPRFKPMQVLVVDQFDEPTLFTVEKPRRFCTPVDKNHEGIANEADHLLCYDIKRPRRGHSRHGRHDRSRDGGHDRRSDVHINNQFGPLQLDTRSPNRLCVPSAKQLAVD